jgi:hypothetical protein
MLDHFSNMAVDPPPMFLLHLHDQPSVELLKAADHWSVIVKAVSDDLTKH